MAKELRLLNQVDVAAPCPASWDEMKGDDQIRHCSMCRHNVYNLSEMTAEAAEKLLREKEGRVCVRFYRREDGKILTQDCPQGLKSLRQRAVRRVALAASFVLTAIGCASQGQKIKTSVQPTKSVAVKKSVETAPVMGNTFALPTSQREKYTDTLIVGQAIIKSSDSKNKKK